MGKYCYVWWIDFHGEPQKGLVPVPTKSPTKRPPLRGSPERLRTGSRTCPCRVVEVMVNVASWWCFYRWNWLGCPLKMFSWLISLWQSNMAPLAIKHGWEIPKLNGYLNRNIWVDFPASHVWWLPQQFPQPGPYDGFINFYEGWRGHTCHR